MNVGIHDNVKHDSPKIMEEFLNHYFSTLDEKKLLALTVTQKKFLEEQNFCTKAVALNSFTKSYLQASKDNIEHRKNFSSNVCSKIPELFAVLTQFNSITSYNADKEVKVLNLQSSTLCLETLLVCFECFETNEHLLSLLQITLKILFQAYTHCEMSESLYGDLLEDFTDQLACFYQRIQDVQIAMVSQIDRLITINLRNTDDILSISDDLGKLCKLVSCLDAMIAAKLWRIFIKIVTHFSSIVRERLEVDSVLISLLASISNINYECKLKLNSHEKIEKSDVKILVFQLNLVMKIFHVFHGRLGDSIQKLRTLVLELHELLIICHSSEEAENDIRLFKSALLSSISPIISLFYSDKSFLMSTLELNSTEISSDFHLPHLFLKLAALKYLNTNDVTTEDRKVIFKRIFETLQQSKPNDDLQIIVLQLPQSLFCGEREQSTTLYVELYKCISEFSKTIPDSDFNKLKDDMMEFFFSSSESLLLLISDVWMYRLRCGSIENLYVCCISFSQEIVKMKSNVYFKLLFKRMLKFLPPNKKFQLLDCGGDLKYLLDDNQRVCHRFGVPQTFGTQPEATPNYKNIVALIDELKKPVTNEEQKLVQKAICILELFSLFVDVAQNEDILKFSEFAMILSGTEIYEIQIAVLTFLKAMKGKQLTKNCQKETTHSLTTLMTEALKSSNYIVRHEAFNTYRNIAYLTPHPEIFQDITVNTPELIPVTTSYFNKVPVTGFLRENERMKYLQIQLRISANQKRPQMFSENCKKVLFQLK